LDVYQVKTIILTAILGDIEDKLIDPVEQDITVDFHRFTDKDFPPIVGLTPRLQYRIPKTHGWQMKPGYDFYIWLDGITSFKRSDSARWYLEQLGKNDIALFHHPQRHTIRREMAHVEDHLQKGKPYITPRYKGGLHKEQTEEILGDPDYIDDKLWASTTFIYRNNEKVQAMMKEWLYTSVRYFSVDQLSLPYLLWKHKLKVKDFDEPIYKTGYMSLVSHHK